LCQQANRLAGQWFQEPSCSLSLFAPDAARRCPGAPPRGTVKTVNLPDGQINKSLSTPARENIPLNLSGKSVI